MQFSDKQRRIFGPYFNGVDTVYADPIRVYRALQHCLGGKLAEDIEKANAASHEDNFVARDRLTAAAHFAFGLRPFDPKTGDGMTETEVREVLAAYLRWFSEKKESGQTSRT